MKYYLTLIFLLSGLGNGYGQKPSTDYLPGRSSLSYQALTKFYQSTVTTGMDGGYDFKASIFGIHRLFQGHRLELSSFYTNSLGTAERNTEITLGLQKGNSSSQNYTALSGGIKYAIVNKRDKAKVNFFNQLNAEMQAAGKKEALILQPLYKAIPDGEAGDKMREKWQAQMAKFDQSYDVKDLPDEAPASYKEQLSQDWKSIQDKYDSLSKSYDRKGLWTIGAQSGYDWATAATANTTFMTQYVKGIGDANHPYEIDAQAKYLLQADTTNLSHNLDRHILSISLGINKVLIRTPKGNPFLEFELAADYTDLLDGKAYTGENTKAKNGIVYLRLHLSDQFTLPVSAKFDVEHPNLFGFIQLQWNFETQTTKNSN